MEEEGTTGDVDSLPRGAFRCRLCHVTVANKPSLDDHLRGKKHQRLENLRSVRQSQELRSIFVSGFQKGTTATELSTYFETYGKVINVVMDKDKGVYAIVELQDEEILQKVLAEPQHSLGGQKLRVKPREKKDFRYTPPKKQGSARREQMSPEKLAQIICQVDDVDAQMALMVQLFEFSESERRLRDLLVKLFQEVFSEFFPESVILPFGSSVNGFSVSGCDLDLFLDLEKTKNFQASAKATNKPPAEEQEAMEVESRSEDSILSDIDLVTATVPEILDLVATVLQKCVPGVHHVQVVSTARRPVVKFCHKESSLRGDISINNKLALCNTRFLQFCTEADERVRPLVYAVRYWAKQQGLAGNLFGGGPLLNNYALTLLVFFFLQTRSPSVLPTVARLKDLTDDGELTVVDGWDCTFPKDPASLQPSGNPESCCCLLAEFFRVFECYNFAGGVISLREGRSLPLSDFLLSDAGQKFKVGPINLQDPFELSHNVAANVNEKTALRLQRSCQDAAKYCRSLQYQRKSTKGKTWGLVRLFQPGSPQTAERLVIFLPLTPAAPSLGSHPELRPSRDWPQLSFQRTCAGIAFVLQHVLKCGCSEKPQGFGDDWESLSSDPEEEPLEKKTEQLSVGSKRSLSVEDATLGSPPAKRSRSEFSLADVESVAWDCTVWHRVWLGRRRVRRQFSAEADPKTSTDPLELEGKVSEAISQQEGETRPVDPLFGFTVCASIREGVSGEDDPQISLNFIPNPEQGALFQDFFHFLQGFLPRMVEQYLITKPSDLPTSEDKSSLEDGI
ncbi:speckle targeted PIP5K1A-regulated poly(A) polymerase isoform X2 [Pseudonaja textilis]|uniref:speckle targeted PIP5K1A-regulated poly(A) polymerase isoform X2 n=1 Tax=Pseudonaja textilis TaxID=8673 RepID=UPI000EA9FB01|nr:speckle targeted PIP5K1A-regulated poly(A) polymerase isoform X2 [Pseudonaja textilis]